MQNSGNYATGNSHVGPTKSQFLEQSQPTALNYILRVVIFTLLALLLLSFNINFLEKNFQTTQMDCREYKCYRENRLDYNRKTWLDIQNEIFKDCHSSISPGL